MRSNNGPADDTEAEWNGKASAAASLVGQGGVIGQGAGGIPMTFAAC